MGTQSTWADGLVEQIAERVYERISRHLASAERIGGDKLTFSEAEAAELLGVPRHVLKAARERGEISPAKIGKGYRYSRELLVAYANRSS